MVNITDTITYYSYQICSSVLFRRKMFEKVCRGKLWGRSRPRCPKTRIKWWGYLQRKIEIDIQSSASSSWDFWAPRSGANIYGMRAFFSSLPLSNRVRLIDPIWNLENRIDEMKLKPYSFPVWGKNGHTVVMGRGGGSRITRSFRQHYHGQKVKVLLWTTCSGLQGNPA